MGPPASPDYGRGAATFRRARALPPAVLGQWAAAVSAAVRAPRPAGWVLDLGSGAGNFLAPLREWFGAPVLGVEPSGSMRAESIAAAVAGTHVVGGCAEQLPVRDASVAVAWLSTVVHQFADREAAARELARAVCDDGWVLLRGYFRDLGPIGWFGAFPGIERSMARFPSTDDVVAGFARVGFRTVTSEVVEEHHEFEVADWVARARALRTIDSMLVPLTDDEFEAGIAAVERSPAASATAPVPVLAPLRFVALTRP